MTNFVNIKLNINNCFACPIDGIEYLKVVYVASLLILILGQVKAVQNVGD